MSMALAMVFFYYSRGVTTSTLLVERASTRNAFCALYLTRLDLRGTANLGSGTDLVHPSGRVHVYLPLCAGLAGAIGALQVGPAYVPNPTEVTSEVRYLRRVNNNDGDEVEDA